jgi:hypothetical protein
MAQHDYNIANASFPTVRTDINNVLSAINSTNSGSSRPSGAVAGTIWLDTSGAATAQLLKMYDGAADILLGTVNFTANTVDFADSASDLVGDTTPQLGGMLDVNGNAIGDGTLELLKFVETSSAVNEFTITNNSTGNNPILSATGTDTNIGISILPKGSGKVTIDNLTFPAADGSANQILTTNGSGVLSFGDASAGGTSWVSAVKTSNFTAVAGEGYFVNTAGGAFEIDLPGSPSVGDEIEFVDFTRNFATANLTLDQGSLKFQGSASPKPVYSTAGQNIRIVYSGSTQGWIPLVDDDVSLQTPQTYSADFLVIAGGGGGSGDGGSGGSGAGGYRNSFNSETSGGGGSSETALALTPGTTYTVTVAAGGTAGPADSSLGGPGGNSSITGSDITDIVSIGGGVGGINNISPGQTLDADGTPGGSGGGADLGTGADGTANQGFKGGNSDSGGSAGGGGGGAGAVGANNSGSNGGAGGAGLASSITGSSITRGGGGGGATSSGTQGAAGSGGGGIGGKQSPVTQSGNGTANTGGGGGGKFSSTPHSTGGSGVVVLRMATSDYTGTKSGSPTVSTSGSDTILLFNSSGSYTA